ncbi:UDP-3-O-acyl-N-acetylglucosamine deacetylase [Desulfopila sp. IMCC35006]|uniref:UDP-3-O-acyl-N-acetylglucosamine deacetylase n=1 Tax=Desulfopila sp. IMCC35006 TaxID=2569542 RepID=UPI0010AD96F7|nr:UDP-3-O-acyl-N-acetylglucosamine deacetylase [Desulfopila sp. IMCC35006]TKB27401.1 UDP-3-O-acyl-N-acetylglucosamine deacetylase [Desulfopila sp. IMCC35006]
MSAQMDPYQHTLRKSASCCGVGLHSGRTVNLAIKPAPVNNGIRFFRSDVPNGGHIQAYMDRVVDTQLATTLGNEHFRISTTEHLLAALRGVGIDNANVELDSGEIPIMDGSAEPFFKLLKMTGRSRQNGLKKILRIIKPVTHKDGDKHLTISPYNGFRVTGEICFDDTLIKKQRFTYDLAADRFGDEIARARTFGYVEQVEELWANGLALGSSLANVIAIHWNRKSVLNEDGLRYDDEFIRHKVLDLVGDLTLLGYPVLGHVTAYKVGHTQHLGLMQAIAAAPDCWEIVQMKKNGQSTALSRIAAKSREAGDAPVPLFNYEPRASAA